MSTRTKQEEGGMGHETIPQSGQGRVVLYF